MSPNTGENTQLKKPDDKPGDLNLSDAERENRVLALADDYYLAVNKIGISPEERAAVGKKWKEKLQALGVRFTNSMPQWFADSPGAYNAYDLHSDAVEDKTPAAKYLKQLAVSEPEFFELCRETEKANSKLFKEWSASGFGEEDFDFIIARWKLDLRMTEAFNKMLSYPGATEEALDELTR